MTFWRRSGAGRGGPEDISEIRLAGLDRPIALRRSRRARRLSLRVNEAKRGAVLTLPLHVGYAEAGDFLARHFEWLRERLAELPEPVPFAHGTRFPLRGEDRELLIAARSRGRAKVWLEPCPESGESPFAYARAAAPAGRVCVLGPAHQAPGRLLRWLKGEARGDLMDRIRHHAGCLEVRPARISIRDQATRWGSCSAAGALSFSWRLILAPPFVLDYVAAHEVAHLRELNHGARFWALVASTTPRLEEARAWLKSHGPRLHRYGTG